LRELNAVVTVVAAFPCAIATVAATVSRIAKTLLELRAGELLHAAIRNADVALLLVHVIEPTGGIVVIGDAVGSEDLAGISGRASTRRIVIARGRVAVSTHVVVAGEEHLRAGVLSVNANKITCAQVISVGDLGGRTNRDRTCEGGGSRTRCLRFR